MSFSSKIEYDHFNEVNEAMISYGTEKPLAYRTRLVDERLQRLLTTFSAVEIRDQVVRQILGGIGVRRKRHSPR